METIYERKKPAHEILIEYYAYSDLRNILEKEWKEEEKSQKFLVIKQYIF